MEKNQHLHSGILRLTKCFIVIALMHYSNLNAQNTTSENPGNNSKEHHLGDAFGGGIIFYLDSTGQHGLISSTKDQKTFATWGFFKNQVTAYGVSIGTGLQNTRQIAKAGKKQRIAAVFCYTLELNDYEDWYLPSREELLLMYNNLYLKNLGNFGETLYWSSSETDFNNAWVVDFRIGMSVEQNVVTPGSVRAIRSF